MISQEQYNKQLALRNLNDSKVLKDIRAGNYERVVYEGLDCHIYLSTNFNYIYVILPEYADVKFPSHVANRYIEALDGTNDSIVSRNILELAPSNNQYSEIVFYTKKYDEEPNKKFVVIMQDETYDYQTVSTGSFFTRVYNHSPVGFLYKMADIRNVEPIQIYFVLLESLFNRCMSQVAISTKPYADQRDSMLIFPGKDKLFNNITYAPVLYTPIPSPIIPSYKPRKLYQPKQETYKGLMGKKEYEEPKYQKMYRKILKKYYEQQPPDESNAKHENSDNTMSPETFSNMMKAFLEKMHTTPKLSPHPSAQSASRECNSRSRDSLNPSEQSSSRECNSRSEQSSSRELRSCSTNNAPNPSPVLPKPSPVLPKPSPILLNPTPILLNPTPTKSPVKTVSFAKSAEELKAMRNANKK